MANEAIGLREFYEYDIDVPSRTLWLGPETEDLQVERIIKGLHLLDKTKGDIFILSTNVGGNAYAGYAIYDAIKTCKNPTTMTCYGQCMSAGALIMQAATRRALAANCRVLTHYGESWYEGHAKDAERAGEEAKYVNSRMEAILFHRMHKKNKGLTMEALRGMLNFDTYLTAHEAVRLGLADEVLK